MRPNIQKLNKKKKSRLKEQWEDYRDVSFQPFRKDSPDHVDEVMLDKETMFIISKLFTLR